MKFKEAEAICRDLLVGKGDLAKHFNQYTICGSLRRKCENIGDIDLVVIEKIEDMFGTVTLSQKIELIDPTGKQDAQKLGKKGAARYLSGSAIKRFKYKGIMIDLYLATEETFSTLTLIRTGSTEHNIRLVKLARSKFMKLYASGKGLCKIKGGIYNNEPEEIIRVVEDTEDGILKHLLGRIPPPEQRN